MHQVCETRSPVTLRGPQVVREREPGVCVHGIRTGRVGSASRQHRVDTRAGTRILRHGTFARGTTKHKGFLVSAVFVCPSVRPLKRYKAFK